MAAAAIYSIVHRAPPHHTVGVTLGIKVAGEALSVTDDGTAGVSAELAFMPEYRATPQRSGLAGQNGID